MDLMKPLDTFEDGFTENKSKKNSMLINKIYIFILIFIGLTFKRVTVEKVVGRKKCVVTMI